MAISHVNQVPAANITNINGVLAANVGEIQGATASLAPTYNSKGAITELHEGYRPIVTYDEDTDRLICVYQDSDNNRLAYVMATLDDDGTINAHSDNDIDTASCKPLAIEYNKRINKVILLYIDDDVDKTYIRSGDVTGGDTNTISWGSRDLISNAKFENANATYETVHNIQVNLPRKNLIFIGMQQIALELVFAEEMLAETKYQGTTLSLFQMTIQAQVQMVIQNMWELLLQICMEELMGIM